MDNFISHGLALLQMKEAVWQRTQLGKSVINTGTHFFPEL
jgi:hypothetical protein